MRVAISAAAATAMTILVWPVAAQAAQTLTVSKTGSGTGTVVSFPAGINCGSTCSASFAQGATVTLSAVSGPNAQPVQWAGCDSVAAENKCVVTMSAERSVTATFDLIQRQLAVSKTGSGTGTVTSSPAGIECGSTCSASFANGTSVTLTAVSGLNTQAVKWSGCSSVDGENKCLVTMNAARSITASFVLNQRQLSVTRNGTGTGTVTSSPVGIGCGSTCAANFDEGSTVTLTGILGEGTESLTWSGCDSVDAEGRCLVTMSAARSVTATFSLPGFQLTVAKAGTATGTVASDPVGIECGEACTASFLKGSTVTLSGAPGTHSQAVSWAGCDSVTAENKCVVTMSSARSVTATFDLQPQYSEYTIAVQKTGTGQGTVSSTPGGIECGGDCSEAYVYHTQLTLIATPAPGSEFVQWVGGTCTGQTGPCSSSVNKDRYLKAVFVAFGTRPLTVAKAGTGSGTVTSDPAGIDCGSVCSAEFDVAAKVVLTATPSAGSSFSGWSGAACSGAATCRVLMNEARNVTATFAKPSPASGTLSLAGGARIKAGKARLRASCHGAAACHGTLKLVMRVRNAQGQSKGLVVGSASYDLPVGVSRTLGVKLSARAIALARSQGRLRVRVAGTGVESRAVRLVA